MSTLAPTRTELRVARRAELGAAGRRQGVALVGQLVGGLGNLLVSVLLARLLLPGEYAALTAFLGGYVLLHTVAASVTAATALDPGLHDRLLRRAVVGSLVLGAGIAAAAPYLGPVSGLPVAGVALLGAAAPSAVLLALARGRLYAVRRVGGTAATLVTEPVVRGLLGVALAPVAGTVGAAAGVVAAGYAALLVAVVAGRGARVETTAPARRPTAVTLTFLLVAVVAAEDVILANRLLPGDQAGLVAAVATIGGAAYFATATIPLVLMPSAGERTRGSLTVALGAALAVSLAAVGAVAAVPASGYAAVVGEAYRGAATYAVWYVAAMAALGVAKVLLARLCMTGHSVATVALVALAVAVQLTLLLRAHTAADVVTATGAACALLLGTSGTAVLVTRAGATAVETGTAGPEPRRRARRAWRTPWTLLIALAVGIGLRLLVTRSIWLDEAISIRQVQQPVGDMIHDLQTSDVHPPGFDVILWATVHVTGSTAEWSVRLPSMVAGTLLIGVFYAMARDLWNLRTAKIAAVVVAVSPIGVWYAQEARMYALWMLFATLALWAQLRILRDADAGEGASRGKVRDWLLFAVASTATGYLQWFAVLPMLVQHAVFLAALFRRRTRRIWPLWLGAVALSLLMFAPLVRFALAQGANILDASAGSTPGQTGGDAAASVSGDTPDVYAVLANLIWGAWGYHADSLMIQLSALWPLLLLGSLAALGRGRSRNVVVLILVGLVPPALLFGIGFERRQLFELRYFTSTVPVLLLLLSRAAARWPRGRVSRVAVPVVLVASLAAGLADQQVNQSNPRTYDFRGAVSWISDESGTDTNDVVVYVPEFLRDEMKYYTTDLPTVSSTTLDPDQPRVGLPEKEPGAGRRSVFVFGSFLDEPATAAEAGRALAELENAGYERVGHYAAANVTVWELRKGAS